MIENNKFICTDFLNPPNEYRGKPFWSWNGKLEKEELLRQIHVMKRMGFGGFFMHSRTGLETEYLGDEWFDLINTCADEAEKKGMEAWLYDEDRWPSGTAGGMVTENPRYRMKYLRLEKVPASEFVWDASLLAAFVCRLDGLNFHDCHRLDKDDSTKDYAGYTVLVFTIEEMEKEDFYNGQTYVDTLNKEAAERFIELTHEKYKAKCGSRLGKSIKGVFTDEPHRGLVMCKDGHQNKDLQWLVPWTYELFPEFEKKFGYDLVDRLPELFLRKDGSKISQVKWHFMEHLQQMFIDNWAKPQYEWCKDNDLLLTGHVLHEDSLASQALASGSVMRYYEYMDHPGIDVLGEHNNVYWAVKQVSSVARQFDKEKILSELYGCTGWQMNFESHIGLGNWQALFGINVRCPHLSWYTMKGEAKRDYPASILHQSAWHKEYKYIETYFARINSILEQGQPDCDILVVNPVETLWAQIYPGWGRWLQSNSADIDIYEQKYTDMFNWLSGNHHDFDYGDEDHIKRFARIDSSGEEPLFWIGQSAYKVVVVAGMDTIRKTTLDMLEEFIGIGGKVIFAGELPAYVDATPSKRISKIKDQLSSVDFNEADFIEALGAVVECPARILKSDSCEIEKNIFVQSRTSPEGKFVLATNIDRDESKKVTVQINKAGCIQEWEPLTGEQHRLAVHSVNDSVVFQVDFAPGELKIFHVVADDDDKLPAKPAYEILDRKSISGPFKYQLNKPNICVLDFAKYKINNSLWSEKLEILKLDREVRTKLGLSYRSGQMLQPWYQKKHGGVENKLGKIDICYDFDIKHMPESDIELVLESPECFQVSVNGQSVDLLKDNGRWIDVCFHRFCIPLELLKIGRNEIILSVDFSPSINIEAIYLLGNFGVDLDGSNKILVNLPDVLYSSDVAKQGLPFYSGKVTYLIDGLIQPEDGERIMLELSAFEAACVLVKSEKGSKIIASQPYRVDVTDYVNAGSKIEIECVLTRRNTFGPLHQIPLVNEWYGPENFVTEGEAFTSDYMLYKSGLLEELGILTVRPRYYN